MNLTDVVGEPLFRVGKSRGTLSIYGESLKAVARHGLTDSAGVSVESVAAYLTARLPEVQPQTIKKEMIYLCAVLGHLERTGRFDAETLCRVGKLKPRVRRPGHFTAPFLTRAQVEVLCAAARVWCETTGRASFVESTVAVAAHSGLRAGELCRLRWEHVDLTRRVISVWANKTSRSRVVPITIPLLAVLTAHPGAIETRARGGLVLSRGASLSVRSLERRLERLRARAGVHVNVNLLRHSRATAWVGSGVDLARVSKWLGHSPEICARFYASIQRGYDPEADRAA